MKSMGLISRFGSTFTVLRYNPGQYIKGHWVGGASMDEFEIIASIQPLTGRELMEQPEGERTRDQIKLYTTSGLHTAVESQQMKADIVVYKNKQYEVTKVESWDFPIDGAAHFKIIAMLKGGS
jgi:hypothetical protein